jgi:hypothetical protein
MMIGMISILTFIAAVAIHHDFPLFIHDAHFSEIHPFLATEAFHLIMLSSPHRVYAAVAETGGKAPVNRCHKLPSANVISGRTDISFLTPSTKKGERR